MKKELKVVFPENNDFNNICDYVEENIVNPNLSVNGGTLNYKKLTYNSDILLIFIVDNEIVGYNSLVYDCKQLYIYQIGIIQKYQNQGIGTIMMQKAIQIADKNNLIVTAHVKDYNKSSQKMFENLGFIKDSFNSKPDNYFYVLYQPKLSIEKSKNK